MKLFKYIFTLIALVSTFNAASQVYPVQVTVATTPPYYNYLSHYVDQNNHLLLVATLTDFNSPPVNVRLRFTIEGNGYKVRTRQDIPVGQVYTLSPGVPVFIQGDELLPYLSEQNLAVLSGTPDLNNLHEGITTICVEVVENVTGGAILSNSNCTSFLLQLMQPPQPFLPVCGSVVDTTSMFQTFQWSQPQNYIPSIGSQLNYTFSLYEWIDTNNYNIFQTGQGLVYTNQTTSPIVQVSNFDVAFQKGRKYVWRVQAQLSSNGMPIQMITQNGLSQPCTFYYGKPTSIEESLSGGLSINLSTQALTTRKGQAMWTVTDETPGQGLSTYSSYIVEYRKKAVEGSETVYPWSIDTVTALMLPIYQLEPEQTYEVRVSGRAGGYTSERTPISEFTTPAAREYACGESDLPYTPENFQPLEGAHMGDVVQIGQFPLRITQIAPLGIQGRYSGYGEIPHDFIGGAKVKVRFDNLLIDRDYVVREGVANAMTDGAEGWLQSHYLDHAFRDTVGLVTSYGYSGDSTSIFVVVNGDTLTYEFDLPYPIVIYGEGNVAYQFWPDGTVTTTTWGTTPSNDQLDATKNFYVRFDASEGAEKLFDKKQYDHFAANYEVIQCKEGFNYWVPNTAKGTTGTTQVKATVHVNTQGYTPGNISFVVKGGYTTVPHTQVNDTTFILTLPAKSFDYQVYAMYEESKLGKLNVMSYDSVTQKLHIVPLVSMGNLTPSTIAQGLNNQFKASRLGFEVIIDSVFNTPEFTSQTVFTNPDANVMEKYTAQMRALREAFVNERELSSDEYVVFIIPGFENPEIDGYMVRGKGLGFITAGTLGSSTDFIQTLAHELGHGIGGLEHSWGSDQSKKEATTNLMDYGSTQNKTLTRLQWDAMHDAPFTLSLFDDEEDALASKGLVAYYVWEEINNNYTGKPIHSRMKDDRLIIVGSRSTDAELPDLDRNYYNSVSADKMKEIIDKNITKFEIHAATTLKSIAFYRQGDGAWKSYDHAPVMYFELKELSTGGYKRTFMFSNDSIILSHLNKKFPVKSHYLVKVFKNLNGSFDHYEIFDLAGNNLTNQFLSITHNPPKRYLVFSNGYRGPIDNWNESDGMITTNDRFGYWGSIDNSFMSAQRLNIKTAYYIDGSFRIWTSNHENFSGFLGSMTGLSDQYKSDNVSYLEHGVKLEGPKTPYLSFSELNTTPNLDGFNYRKYMGTLAGKAFLAEIKKDPRSEGVRDTVDIVAHSMGYAYAVGFVEAIKSEVHFGRFYIIAPENACSGGNDWTMFEEVWQYGSNNNSSDENQAGATTMNNTRDPYWWQDGVAPQCAVYRIDELPKENTVGGRAYIPKTVSTHGFVESHSITNYTWIFNLTSQEKGYVRKR